jgi:hypothetical protein
MTLWKILSQKNTDKFEATGDIRYALKALAADARAPTRPQFKLIPATVEDLFAAFENITKSGGEVEDPFQKLLNKKVAQFLLAHLKDVRPELPVLRGALPTNHLTGFIPEVLPFDKDSLVALRQHLLDSKYPTEEIRSIVRELSYNNESLRNALSFALGMAFISVIKQQIINNPILTVLPNNLVKSAAPKKGFQYRSPRLNDLIEAMRIAHGKYLIEYNQAVLADFMQGSMDFEVMFPAGPPPGHQKSLANLPAQLAVLSAAYMRHYKELQKALHDYCWANIADVNTRVISNSGEVLTPNIYINPNITDVKGVRSITNLLSKEQKLASLDLNMTMWNGEKYSVASTNLNMGDIRTKFLSNRTYADVAFEVIDGAMESMESARAHMQAQSSAQLTQAIAKLMSKPNAAVATDILDEFIVAAKGEVNKAITSESNQFLEASNEAKRTYGSGTPGGDIAGTSFKTKDLDNIRAFNEEMMYAFEAARTQILNKYGPLFADKTSLQLILSNIFKLYAMPLLPLTMRYVYNAPSAIKLVDAASQPLTSEKEIKSINDKLGTLTDGFLPHLSAALSSQAFAERYAANEEDYKSSVINTDAISKLRDESLGSGVAASKLEPLLKYLGIDDTGIKAKQADIALTYSGAGQDAGRRTGDLINKILADIMSKYYELQKQGVTRDVTWEHVSVYVCNKVLPGIIEEYVTEVLSKKLSAKTSERREEIERFINTDFMSLKGGRGGAVLASNTIYGKLSQLYRAFADKQGKGEDASRLLNNSLGAMIIGADYGFRAARAAPALSAVREFFEKNKSDASVTDENWSDPANPRPRSWEELAQITKAFADPVPDTTSHASGIVRKTRLNIQPGERLSREQIDKLNAQRLAEGKGEIVEPSVYSSLVNTVRRLGNNLLGNPVGAIRMAMLDRRKEVLSISPAYEKDIVPYTKGGDVPFKQSPFVSTTYIPPQVEVDFSSVKLDAERSSEITDKSDENPIIKSILDDLAKSGVPTDTLQKVEKELQKLPPSYLTDKSIGTTVEMILGKVAPALRSTIRREQNTGKDPALPAPKQEEGEALITSLSKTIFSGGKLADRLVPQQQDGVARLNSKAEELMKYLQAVVQAQASLSKEMSAAGRNPVLLNQLRDLLSTSKVYRSQLLKAINKAKDMAEREAAGAEEEFDYIKESLTVSRDKVRDFISRMSQSPQYKDKADTVRRVSMALDSLVNVKDLGDAVSPQHLQLLLMDLNRRLSAGDDFSNLLLELDKYRVRNTRPPSERAKREEVKDIDTMFDEQAERWESAIKQEQSQLLTDPNQYRR